MAHWFEDLTKTMADDKLPRRQAIRRIAGSVAGVALASWLPEQALATNLPGKNQCGYGGSCDWGFTNCHGNPNYNCFCFTGAPGAPAVFCGCNSYCSQSPTCKRQRHCPRGTVCSTSNGCTGCSPYSGVCIPKCMGKNKNCTLGSGHGLTAAR
jgi:hypothetical protein